MSEKITLITTAHSPLDDRIFYHFAKTFQKHHYSVSIVCSTKNIDSTLNGIHIQGFENITISQKEKLLRLISMLETEKPDKIICSEPLAVLAAHRFRKKTNSKCRILFDITEWYPSKVNLFGTQGTKKYIKAAKLILFNLYASILCNGFIFGEYYKSKPYKLFFPLKKSILISYYPNLEYIPRQDFPLLKDSVSLCFTGKLCEEKGFHDFLKTALLLHKTHVELKIILNIIGWFAYESDKKVFQNFVKTNPKIEIQLHNYLDFNKFIETIQKSHLFFDLRKPDMHNHHCLPIKLFYYMAVGRPVIYTNLKAIRKELDISSFGHLVNPEEHGNMVRIIMDYLQNPEKYEYQGQSARQLAESDYNWNRVENELVQFVSRI